MDLLLLEKMLKMTASQNDSDALMGLRGVQGLFVSEGATIERAIAFAAARIGELRATGGPTIDQAPAAPAKKSSGVVNVSGMPDCRVLSPGRVELVLPGKDAGAAIDLPGLAAESADMISAGFKDALVAAVINKSRFKLKLVDVKDKKGEIVETVLQAEYERAGMIPVRIWGNVRGEVAALAAALRKAVANALPDLVAA